MHGAGAAVPPAHQLPTAQSAPVAFVDPAPQKLPGGAAQGPLHAAVVSQPVVLPKVPAGHGTGGAPPAAQYAPAGHGAQTARRTTFAKTALM